MGFKITSIPRRVKARRFRSRVRRAKALLRWIDKAMVKAQVPAWKRQQIRRDIITSDKAWVDYLDLLEAK